MGEMRQDTAVHRAIRRLVLLCLLMGICPGLIAPALADARPRPGHCQSDSETKQTKKKKKRRKRRQARRTKKRRAKSRRAVRKKRTKAGKRRRARASRSARKKRRKVTAKLIRKWQKRGLSDRKILARVERYGGYKLDKRKWRRLKKYRVRRSLRKELLRAHKARRRVAVARAKGVDPIDIDAQVDPDDIDFDSVAPPEGMDMEFADMHRQEAQARNQSKRKRRRRTARRSKRRPSQKRRVVIAPSGSSD